MQIFHGDQLRDGKAVVHFEQADLPARIGDTRLLVGAIGGDPGRRTVTAAPPGPLHFPPVGDRHLDGLHGDESVFPSARAISGVVTMAHAAPSETPQQSNKPSGSAIIGAPEHRVQGDLFAKMRLGILGAIGVAFHGDMRHGLLQVSLGNAVLHRVGRGELSEIARAQSRPRRPCRTCCRAFSPADRRTPCPSVSRRPRRALYRPRRRRRRIRHLERRPCPEAQ